MDLITSCYRSQMRLFRDRPDILVWGRWYWCPPGAIAAPFLTPFVSSTNDPSTVYLDPPLGEVGGRQGLSRGIADPRALGRQVCGSEEAWTQGVLYSERGRPAVDAGGLPPCCDPPPLLPGGALGGGGGLYFFEAMGGERERGEVPAAAPSPPTVAGEVEGAAVDLHAAGLGGEVEGAAVDLHAAGLGGEVEGAGDSLDAGSLGGEVEGAAAELHAVGPGGEVEGGAAEPGWAAWIAGAEVEGGAAELGGAGRGREAEAGAALVRPATVGGEVEGGAAELHAAGLGSEAEDGQLGSWATVEGREAEDGQLGLWATVEGREVEAGTADSGGGGGLQFALTGVTNGFCSDCDSLNTTFALISDGGGNYTSGTFSLCGVDDYQWVLSLQGDYWHLSLIRAGEHWLYLCAAVDFDTAGTSVFSRIVADIICSGAPDTIAVTPA